MISKSKLLSGFVAAALVFSLSAAVFADTIRMKDGTIVKGKVVGFRDGQFIVLIGKGANRDVSTRSSQMMLNIEDVDTVEFDNESGAAGNNSRIAENTPPARNDEDAPRTSPTQKPAVIVSSNLPQREPTAVTSVPRTNQNNGGLSQVINSQPTTAANQNTTAPRGGSSNGKFFSLNVKVLADATANGWTNAGLVVKKGQRIRISANGRVSLGSGRFATPAGVGSISDGERLMQTEPTGALIAVIGDDNNEFVFVGSSREFVAPRDGTLFLGINEGNLEDNSGAFEATIEAEAVDATAASSRR